MSSATRLFSVAFSAASTAGLSAMLFLLTESPV
jgi:hypothetical protein